MTIFHDDAIREQVSVGIADFEARYTLDNMFRPNASTKTTVIEGEARGPIREIRMAPGERWDTAEHDEMNQAFQDKTLEELQRPSEGADLFFLRYWPMIPLHNTRTGRTGPESPNGGLYVD